MSNLGVEDHNVYFTCTAALDQVACERCVCTENVKTRQCILFSHVAFREIVWFNFIVMKLLLSIINLFS